MIKLVVLMLIWLLVKVVDSGKQKVVAPRRMSSASHHDTHATPHNNNVDNLKGGEQNVTHVLQDTKTHTCTDKEDIRALRKEYVEWKRNIQEYDRLRSKMFKQGEGEKHVGNVVNYEDRRNKRKQDVA